MSGESTDTKKDLTPTDFLEKLKKALTRNGDFPASAKVVSELRMLTSNPSTTADQIAEVILREPSLGIRVLHLVNSSFYRRAQPITTITQAIVQIGMKPLAEMCAGLILLQKFVPEARQSSIFAGCLRRSILTSLLASSLSNELSLPRNDKFIGNKNAESGYLAGTLAEMGVLLTAYYFPQVYESAVKRAEQKGQDIGTSLQQLTGLSPAQLSSEVIKTLQLPQFYADVVTHANQLAKGQPSTGLAAATADAARYLSAATGISEALTNENPEVALVAALKFIKTNLNLDPQAVIKVLERLPEALEDHCSALQVSLAAITMDLGSVVAQVAAVAPDSNSVPGKSPAAAAAVQATPTTIILEKNQSEFDQYVQEIRTALQNREPTTSIITSVMEACAYCLDFDRVLLLLATPGKKALVGRMLLGSIPDFDPTKYSRPIGNDADGEAPDNRAFTQGQIVFQGSPLFGSSSFVAIPVGAGKRSVGVIYAERSKAEKELSKAERTALMMLGDLMDRSLQKTATAQG